MSTLIETNRLAKGFAKINQHRILRVLQWIVGIFVHLIGFILYQYRKKDSDYKARLTELINRFQQSNVARDLSNEYMKQYEHKQAYFNRSLDADQQKRIVNKQVDQQILKMAERELEKSGLKPEGYLNFFISLLHNRFFIVISFIPGIILYSLCLIYQNAFIRYVFERIFMTVFVIISVIVLVFTILHFSPSDAAANILGEAATMEQRMAFSGQYGLDQPYLIQLWNALKGFLTFDLGHSYVGNEVIITSIANRFPITLMLALLSLVLAVVIAIPVGMISAAKVNSLWDYSFMFIALIGLSIPSFWQGLIFILTFSIRLGLLPSTYYPGDPASLIMPVIVLGTGLAAAIARMTRSSMLEVMHEDYMVTARAKGLSGREIFMKHGLRNAWIPILTVIGLQFGAMLGGAAVTEKVFNISGLGSYIVDKQFIPDIPAVLSGVVYIAITISIVNLIVDLLYAVLNPRIRSQMKDS